MALTVSQMAAITHRLIETEIVENIFGANALLFRQRAKGIKYDGGREIVVPVVYQRPDGFGFYEGDDDLNLPTRDNLTAAVYQWRQAFAHVTITGREELLNAGKSAIHSLFKAKMQVAEQNLLDDLGRAIQTGVAAEKEPDGLVELLKDANGDKYGGLDPEDFPDWKARKRTTADAGGMLVKLDIYKLIGACSVGSDAPTVLVTRQSVFDRCLDLWEGQQRFEDPMMADAGFQNMKIRGIPLVVDSHVPGQDGGAANNYLQAINERYFWLYTHSARNFVTQPIATPENKDRRTVRILWAGNVATSRRNMHGALVNIDPDAVAAAP